VSSEEPEDIPSTELGDPTLSMLGVEAEDSEAGGEAPKLETKVVGSTVVSDAV